MTGQVSKPKIFIDYISYFKATNLGAETHDSSSSNIIGDYDDVFTYNPSHTKEFMPVEIGGGWNDSTSLYFKIALGDGGYGESSKLIKSMNFSAILNHNFQSLGSGHMTVGALSTDGSFDYIESNVGYGLGKNNFSLHEWDTGFFDDTNTGFALRVYQSNWGSQVFKLGSFLAGRSFSFPHSANLSMNINYDTGIKKSKTLEGFDVVDVNYYRQPDWDGNPPFVSTNASGLSSTSHVGRRSWDLTFSFLKSDNVHPQNMGDGFMFESSPIVPWAWNNYDTENLISHFMGLSLNGQIPFLLQPDDQVDTFAMCRLRSNSFSVTQSAPNLYTAKMSFDETW